MCSTASTAPISVLSNRKRKELLVEQQDEILIIKINRPHIKNALNRNAVYELIAVVEGATNNTLIKFVVITAVGDWFTAGNDLSEILDYKQPEDFLRGANYVERALVRTLLACPKVVVCLVNGPCIGIGFTLAALCDAVYCTENAYFQAPFSQLGICCGACSSLTFPQQFGLSWSTNLLIFGEKLTAQKAEQFGFVLEIFDSSQVEKFWIKMKEYLKLPEKSLLVSKQLIKANNKQRLMQALGLELKEMDKLYYGSAYKDAIQKSLNKSKL